MTPLQKKLIDLVKPIGYSHWPGQIDMLDHNYILLD